MKTKFQEFVVESINIDTVIDGYDKKTFIPLTLDTIIKNCKSSKYSNFVFEYFSDLDKYSNTNNRLMKLFINNDGNDFSNTFINKLRNQLANNKVTLHTFIIPKIKYALKYSQFNSDQKDIRFKIGTDINNIIYQQNANSLTDASLYGVLVTYADWIFNENTVVKILKKMYNLNVKSFISEYSAKKYLDSIKVKYRVPSLSEDYSGIDIIAGKNKIQVKYCNKVEYNSDELLLTIKNTKIQLGGKSSYNVLFFVTKTNIWIVKYDGVKITPIDNDYFILLPSEKSVKKIDWVTDFESSMSEFKEINDIVMNS